MQKKLLAVAVLSAFSGLAAAQSANVTLYGTLIGDFQMASATGADTNSAAAGAAPAGSNGSTRVNALAAGTAAAFGTGNLGGAYLTTGVTNDTRALAANASTRTRMNPAGSNFGIRGTEDLGNGLSAWFQIEMATTLGAPTPNNGNNHGNAASFRNTAVGLRSNSWGSVLMGSWDTPFNVMAGALNINGRAGSASTNAIANILGATPFAQGAFSAQDESVCAQTAPAGAVGVCFNAGTNFDRRQKGTLQWWSPNWNGFEVRAAYAATANNNTAANSQSGEIKPAIWDLSASYTNGGLMVGYAYERQNGLLAKAAIDSAGAAAGGFSSGVGTGQWVITGAAAAAGGAAAAGTAVVSGSRADGHRLGARYTFNMGGGSSIGLGAIWESLKWGIDYTIPTAGAKTTNDLTELKKTAYRLQGNYVTGKHFFGLEYARANNVTGSISPATGATRSFDGSGTGARLWMLTYNYAISKRTSAGLYYTQVTNDTNANYSGITFGGVATAYGADPKYYGVQVRHSF